MYANRNKDGTVFCWIGGGTGQEQATFLRALRETLSPIDNPRYLLARRKIWRIFREDYFAVPDVLARKKEFAEFFAQRWKRLVGPRPESMVRAAVPEPRDDSSALVYPACTSLGRIRCICRFSLLVE